MTFFVKEGKQPILVVNIVILLILTTNWRYRICNFRWGGTKFAYVLTSGEDLVPEQTCQGETTARSRN
jgi:hypothetical protein